MVRHTLLLLVLAFAATVGADYHPGDFIPTARKGQFQGTRTQWHDLIGRHCPRFALDRTVVVPIPRPVGFLGDEEYKMSFSFEGERHITPWLGVLPPLKKMDPSNPTMLHIRMGHDSSHLRSAKAALEPVPAFFLKKHETELQQFYNSSHWPKHVLLKYSWFEVMEVDTSGGLIFLLGSGLLVSAMIIYNVVRSHTAYIGKFMKETLAEDEDEDEAKHD